MLVVRTQEIQSLCFQSQMLWGFFLSMQAPWCDSVFLTLLHASAPSQLQTARAFLAPHLIFTFPILFHMTSSLPLVMEFLLLVFGWFSVIYADLSVTMGLGELRVLYSAIFPESYTYVNFKHMKIFFLK